MPSSADKPTFQEVSRYKVQATHTPPLGAGNGSWGLRLGYPPHTAQHLVQTPLRPLCVGGLGTVLVEERVCSKTQKGDGEEASSGMPRDKSLGSVEVGK